MARRVLPAIAALAAVAVALAGCGSKSKTTTPPTTSAAGSSSAAGGAGKHLVIGSASFSESQVLAQLYAQLAQKAGYTTEIKTVTTRELYEPALENGQIDIVPDYAATFTEYLNVKANGANAKTLATTDKTTTVAALRKLAQPLGLTALDPSEAADENAFAVTKDFATKNNLKTLSDVATAKLPIKLAAPAECKTRTFCGKALTDVYGINVTRYDPFDFDSVPGKQAAKNGNDDMVLVATDDGTLDQFNLTILADDKHVQLADNLVPIVGKKYATDTTLAAAINKLAPVLTSADLGALDAQVDNDKKLPADVAKAYLQSKSLI
jgi:osmoprotectant transport system substrate-binding protein